MTGLPFSQRVRASLVLATVACLALPVAAAAGDQAAEQRVRSLRRLGGATSRFVTPIPTVDALKKSMAPASIQKDLTAVLTLAKAESLDAEVRSILAEGRVTESTLANRHNAGVDGAAPGTTSVGLDEPQMGRQGARQGLRVHCRRPDQTYTFFVPAVCCNLSLVKREPSREAARRAAETARAEAARQEAARAEAARAEAARRSGPCGSRETGSGRSKPRREAARLEAARAEARSAAAAKAEADRVEAARLEALKQAEALAQALRVRPFIAPLFGKQHGLASSSDGAAAASSPGVKGGVSLALGNSGWRFAPAVGFASNLEEGGRTALLIDGIIRLRVQERGYVGTGPTLWDLNHSDNRTAAWLFGAGVPVWKNEAKHHEAHWSSMAADVQRSEGTGRRPQDGVDRSQVPVQVSGRINSVRAGPDRAYAFALRRRLRHRAGSA